MQIGEAPIHFSRSGTARQCSADNGLLFLEGPTSIGVDRHSVLYAADGLSIVRFTVDGRLLGRWR